MNTMTANSPDLLERLRVTFLDEAGAGLTGSERSFMERVLADGSVALRSWHWQERLAEVASRSASVTGDPVRFLARWGGAFGAGYQEMFDPDDAMLDASAIEDMAQGEEIAIRSYRRGSDPKSRFRFKLYRPGSAVPLADVLAILQPMGLKALVEEGFPLRPEGAEEIWVHEFLVDDPRGEELLLADVGAAFESAFVAIWKGIAENDGFNRLVLEIGASWHEAAIIRALARYRQQTGLDPSQRAQIRALVEHGTTTRLLLELFGTLFDPATGETKADRIGSGTTLSQQIERALQDLPGIEEDRVLRRFYQLVKATKRTNAYVQGDGTGPQPIIALKIASREVADIPEPKPFREIFVSSPWVEGVHMRFGPVARGGLRWSDRPDDFRTETLALSKAQQVKNALIVPVGAKGAFVAKARPGESRDGADAYRKFISAMLEVTDNVGPDGEIQPASQVVAYDGNDPYLVVAADKGTASFSDLANQVALDRDFWLGDAFASGGSAGYDHKAMAITARGAWIAAERHFREVGLNIERDGFTVAAVGDMSGDVFGNFMLLSRRARLVAAFDHRDIFIDPDPDPAGSWRERKRLFDAKGSSWQEYGREVLSPGGGVFSRKAKSVRLSAQARAALGISEETLSPDALIRAILKAPVDLLFMGGIGTYVKAGSEAHPDVGDKANDAIRVEAGEVRARIVSEGANLGVTQDGRIELAAGGIAINSDAVDNSAGVASSDLEVNIKILLAEAQRQGELDPKARTALLMAMTDGVTEKVLAGNHAQTLALSLLEADAADELGHHAAYLNLLERSHRLNRSVERLPSDDIIEDRRLAGAGMTRPELSVLMAHGKLHLFDELLASEATEEPWFEQYLLAYFPDELRAFPAAAERHRLRREIVATRLANEIVDTAGPTFVTRVSSSLACGTGAVALAFAAAGEIFGLRALWKRIGELDRKVAPAIQYPLYRAIARAWRKQTSRLAARLAKQPMDVAELVARYTEHVEQLRLCAAPSLDNQEELIAGGVPAELAFEIAALSALEDSLAIIDIALDSKHDITEVAALFNEVGSRFGLIRLQVIADGIPTADAVDSIAVRQVAAGLRRHHERLCRSIVEASPPGLNSSAAFERWLKAHKGAADVSENIKALDRPGTPWSLGRLVLANAAVERAAA